MDERIDIYWLHTRDVRITIGFIRTINTIMNVITAWNVPDAKVVANTHEFILATIFFCWKQPIQEFTNQWKGWRGWEKHKWLLHTLVYLLFLHFIHLPQQKLLKSCRCITGFLESIFFTSTGTIKEIHSARKASKFGFLLLNPLCYEFIMLLKKSCMFGSDI